MPSRRSDRGGALRRQLERAEAAEPELNAAIEERRRWENERDLAFREGWEEWDNLDTDTRQDLFRESVVVGGLGDVLSVATSPRRLGVSQATKAVLSRAAPELAKRLYAAKPRKAVKGLIERIKDVRRSRMSDSDKVAQQNKQYDEYIDEIWGATRSTRPAGSNTRPAGGDSPYVRPGDINKIRAEILKNKESTPKDLLFVANTLRALTAAPVSNVRDAYYQSGGKSDLAMTAIDKVLGAGEFSDDPDNLRKLSVQERELVELNKLKKMKREAKKRQRERELADRMDKASDQQYADAFRVQKKEDRTLKEKYDTEIIKRVDAEIEAQKKRDAARKQREKEARRKDREASHK